MPTVSQPSASTGGNQLAATLPSIKSGAAASSMSTQTSSRGDRDADLTSQDTAFILPEMTPRVHHPPDGRLRGGARHKQQSRRKRPVGCTVHEWATQLGESFWFVLEQLLNKDKFSLIIPGMSCTDRNFARLRLATVTIFHPKFLEINEDLFIEGAAMFAHQESKEPSLSTVMTFFHYWALGWNLNLPEGTPLCPVTEDQLFSTIEQILAVFPEILKYKSIQQTPETSNIAAEALIDLVSMVPTDGDNNGKTSNVHLNGRQEASFLHDKSRAHVADHINPLSLSDQLPANYKNFYRKLALHIRLGTRFSSLLREIVDRYFDILDNSQNFLDTTIILNGVIFPSLTSLMTVPSYPSTMEELPLFNEVHDSQLTDDIIRFYIDNVIKPNLSGSSQYTISSPGAVGVCFDPVGISISLAAELNYEEKIEQNNDDLKAGKMPTYGLAPGANPEVTDVHTILNLSRNHWVYVRFNVEPDHPVNPDQAGGGKHPPRRGTMYVYDSAPDPYSKRRLTRELIFLARILSQDPDLQWCDAGWVVTPYFERCPQQANGSNDCGPLALDACRRLALGEGLGFGASTDEGRMEHGTQVRVSILSAVRSLLG